MRRPLLRCNGGYRPHHSPRLGVEIISNPISLGSRLDTSGSRSCTLRRADEKAVVKGSHIYLLWKVMYDVGRFPERRDRAGRSRRRVVRFGASL